MHLCVQGHRSQGDSNLKEWLFAKRILSKRHWADPQHSTFKIQTQKSNSNSKFQTQNSRKNTWCPLETGREKLWMGKSCGQIVWETGSHFEIFPNPKFVELWNTIFGIVEHNPNPWLQTNQINKKFLFFWRFFGQSIHLNKRCVTKGHAYEQTARRAKENSKPSFDKIGVCQNLIQRISDGPYEREKSWTEYFARQNIFNSLDTNFIV